MPKPKKLTENRFQQQFDQGIETFCRLFTHWQDKNGWSHPVMLKLFSCCMDGATWFHSSQISAIRYRKLVSPGPRSFMAITELNRCIHEYKTRKKLLPNTTTDLDYLQAYAITEDGAPPSAGWWYEVFCGYRIPKDVPLDNPFATDDIAADFSTEVARLLRRLLAAKGYDLIEDPNRAIREIYPVGDEPRVKAFRDVLFGRHNWSRKEARVELTAIREMLETLGGPGASVDLLPPFG